VLLSVPCLVIEVIASEESYDRVTFVRDDVGTDAVEEESIVRDNQCATCKLQQGLFQRTYCVHVQVVGAVVWVVCEWSESVNMRGKKILKTTQRCRYSRLVQ
jgi:hypothetical protein